jgi:protoheme IX farnesyltransferase
MTAATSIIDPSATSLWRACLELTKPKTGALITFTSIVGARLARPGLAPLGAVVWGSLGIALSAQCAAVLNHLFDRRVDGRMARTRRRPVPTGRVTDGKALVLASVLGIAVED